LIFQIGIQNKFSVREDKKVEEMIGYFPSNEETESQTKILV
jgi:hypothetical protein